MRFFGTVGYVETVESAPGVWTESSTERSYSGDVLRNTRRWQPGENLNDNVSINNSISIIADPYAYQNLEKIKFVEWMGVFWKVTNIDVQRPRLILTIGGVYNGK